ncbi:hypothetical protein [Methanococcoides seepicolus]|uniref:Uncharacterized protein n=1 Tax=Methanococcoides seepicolus TaxID=2828780 RepID=A0A9E4ZHM6_9EURY|nr:hypothetical protein [Methanococcoides seepicolus]MCM1988005.1 hypothetical protein [Methanococcoides seepicolus]
MTEIEDMELKISPLLSFLISDISALGMYILTKEKERRGNYLELTCNSLFSLT